jgi:hypothetical protein
VRLSCVADKGRLYYPHGTSSRIDPGTPIIIGMDYSHHRNPLLMSKLEADSDIIRYLPVVFVDMDDAFDSCSFYIPNHAITEDRARRLRDMDGEMIVNEGRHNYTHRRIYKSFMSGWGIESFARYRVELGRSKNVSHIKNCIMPVMIQFKHE